MLSRHPNGLRPTHRVTVGSWGDSKVSGFRVSYRVSLTTWKLCCQHSQTDDCLLRAPNLYLSGPLKGFIINSFCDGTQNVREWIKKLCGTTATLFFVCFRIYLFFTKATWIHPLFLFSAVFINYECLICPRTCINVSVCAFVQTSEACWAVTGTERPSEVNKAPPGTSDLSYQLWGDSMFILQSSTQSLISLQFPFNQCTPQIDTHVTL